MPNKESIEIEIAKLIVETLSLEDKEFYGCS
jgi:hypothetical protein